MCPAESSSTSRNTYTLPIPRTQPSGPESCCWGICRSTRDYWRRRYGFDIIRRNKIRFTTAFDLDPSRCLKPSSCHRRNRQFILVRSGDTGDDMRLSDGLLSADIDLAAVLQYGGTLSSHFAWQLYPQSLHDNPFWVTLQIFSWQ